MKKIIVSFIAGAVVATAATAYGEEAIESLIGKQIQGQTTVYNDGQALAIAIILDGKSYAPVRDLAEAAGKEVAFGEGEIFLTTPTIPNSEAAEPSSELTTEDVSPAISEIDLLNIRIKQTENQLTNKRIILEVAINRGMPLDFVEETEAKIADLESQLADLQVMKAALEAQQSEGATEG